MSTGAELIPIALAVNLAAYMITKGRVKRLTYNDVLKNMGLGLEEREVRTVSASDTCTQLQTRFTDTELLKKTLLDFGLEYGERDDVIETEYEERRVIMKKNDDGCYTATIVGYVQQEKAEDFLRQLDSLYCTQVQDQSYRNLVERAREHGLTLETEETQQDNSIVLTFNVEG